MNRQPGYRYLNIIGFTVDAMQPLALFKDEVDETTCPLWLEMGDILTITTDLLASRLASRGERPDLLDAVLGTLGFKVAGVLIDGTAENGYLADVCFDGEERDIRVRVELVTALLTAIRYKLPVGIASESLASSSLVDHSGVIDSELVDEKRLLEMLAMLNPEEMGKYPM